VLQWKLGKTGNAKVPSFNVCKVNWKSINISS